MEISNDLLFSFLSYSPGLFWICILFLPKNTKAMFCVDIYLILLSLLFVIQTIPGIGEILSIIFKPTFLEMKAFLSSDAGFLGTWNHMILSDVWIGRWISQDSLQFKSSLLIRLIIIPIILILGPFGLFFYLVLRAILTKSIGFNSIKND
ncbi:abscisic acid-deficient protein Aba4 family protein [Leptospira sp. GIMC2001]|uniref:abscisic acid-deficient protein Aba4 family protein n=1 Tax=Leptospira sp. GIMC2001 TaxID=1513297 RepID=UPI00234A18E3|nr:abscisic acid-deficient protein Aba4 family protein [Leptospira sp. GIMC2001]WCL50016.1 DUF4281 domain-containing protein [Leptospira sp. GIMC2001]